MKTIILTPEQREYLLSVKPPSRGKADEQARADLAENFRRTFDVTADPFSLARSCYELHYRRRKKERNSPHRYTPEEDRFLALLAQEKMNWPQRASRFNRRFGAHAKPHALAVHFRLAVIRKRKPLPARSGGAGDDFIVTVNGREVWRGAAKPAVTVAKVTTTILKAL